MVRVSQRKWLPITLDMLSMRNSAGLTQQELAERMGTQKSNVSRLEHGRSNPSWKMLTRYAHACGYELKLATLER